MEIIATNDNQAIFGKGDFTYQQVIDDFNNTKFIGILTFNVSQKENSYLLSSLKQACLNGAKAVIITNIPKRFTSYYNDNYAFAAKKVIDIYKKQLDPRSYEMRLNPYFAFDNHAKIIMTDNIIYWGSSNFSDESSNNFECGSISRNVDLIKYVKETVFPQLQSDSISYYQDNFAAAIVNVESLIPICEKAKQSLFNATFAPWSDYDTNFEEKWFYRTNDNDLTVSFLREYIRAFSKYEKALDIVDDIIYDYWDLDELPIQAKSLKDLYDEYKHTYDDFIDNITSLFENLEEVARYNVADEACKKISNDYAMEAYDEKLDYYAEKAMNEAAAEFEDLAKKSKQTVIDALENLDFMIHYLTQLKENLYNILEINPKIDNTGINQKTIIVGL